MVGAIGYLSSKTANNLVPSLLPQWMFFHFLLFKYILGHLWCNTMELWHLLGLSWYSLTQCANLLCLFAQKRIAHWASLQKGPGKHSKLKNWRDQMDFSIHSNSTWNTNSSLAVGPRRSQGLVDLKPQQDCCSDPVHSLLDRGIIEIVTLVYCSEEGWWFPLDFRFEGTELVSKDPPFLYSY